MRGILQAVMTSLKGREASYIITLLKSGMSQLFVHCFLAPLKPEKTSRSRSLSAKKKVVSLLFVSLQKCMKKKGEMHYLLQFNAYLLG